MKNQIILNLIFLLSITLITCKPVKEITKGQKVHQIQNGEVTTDKGETINIPGSKKEDVTIVYLVRHAEKQLSGKDPFLTTQGEKRAEKLSEILKNEKIDQIFSTEYNRTLLTAQPTAKEKDLEIKLYNPRKLEEFGKMLLENYSGKRLLVVGHSNTTPTLLNYFMEETIVDSIHDSDYENLFAVTIRPGGDKKALLLKF